LSAAEAERLFAVLRKLRADGTGIVYVSHRLGEVLALADRVTVLRDGRVIRTDDAGLSTESSSGDGRPAARVLCGLGPPRRPALEDRARRVDGAFRTCLGRRARSWASMDSRARGGRDQAGGGRPPGARGSVRARGRVIYLPEDRLREETSPA
jgi:energy-coupling factor transporter ATP-binding protein EcfA2